ncbi:receptor-type tyrosine-protein phosphatase O [Bombina bombina]|uniref:receptor-type tyrosine-protein phosphatase O n=1 Tax=Bombina bombina TaxID=8345 RepID=UPI00235AD70A|nr:receptor-type tyrosine-protein phosphatase O [Bombina bombina]
MALRSNSRPISVASFPEIFTEKNRNENNGFLREFEELKDVGNGQSKKDAELPANAAKNRYPHILPYDHSRVKLTIKDGDLNSGYINANYITGFHGVNEYISTQAPTQASLVDFWRMIWEHKVRNIVMLTVCKEKGKVLCDQYWPSDSASYGPFTVICVSNLSYSDWTIRHFNLHHIEGSKVRTVCQMHYTAWPDHGVPKTPESLITFAELVREQVQSLNDSGPTVVHCSAGVGRSGTFIALDVALQQLCSDLCIDIFKTVYTMRLNRYLMLQTLEQYIFVHRCIFEKNLQKRKNPTVWTCHANRN